MLFIQYGPVTRKLANRSPEDWVRSELFAFPKDDFAVRVLAWGTKEFEPAELAPLIPDEFLREIRRLTESPAELAGLKFPIPSDWEEIQLAASRWFRYFNP
jgi:hypothetical protein